MNKKYIIGLVAIALVYSGLLSYQQVKEALANPSFVPRTARTASATNTPDYMTPGTGTSTLTFNSFQVIQGSTRAFNPTLVNSLAVGIQFHSSTTISDPSAGASRIEWRYEYSKDNVDFYPENVFAATNATNTVMVSESVSYTWQPAPTSTGPFAVENRNDFSIDGFATSSVAKKIVNVPILAQYTRVIFSIPLSSSNGAVWAELLPAKERVR